MIIRCLEVGIDRLDTVDTANGNRGVGWNGWTIKMDGASVRHLDQVSLSIDTKEVGSL